MSAPHRVLVIAYYFPPLGLSGVQRTLKFVKYLSLFGWQPTVLTVDDRGYFAKDEGLLEELAGKNIEIIRTPSLDPLHFFRGRNVVDLPSGTMHGLFSKMSQVFFLPDNKIGWKRQALRAARQELSSKKYDVIYATAPPYTDFLIGTALKREFGIPLVLDYRDAWLQNPLHFYLTPIHRQLHRRMEAKALRYSDHIITINRGIKQATLEAHSSLHYRDVSIIPHGFDSQDFEGSNGMNAQRGKMRFTYAGTFYYNRTPSYFLKALKLFLEKHPEASNEVEALFIGKTRDEDKKLARELGLTGQITFAGYRPHADCVSLLMDSDVLWMTIGNDKGDEMMSTGKLFEYIGTRKPILACIPNGVAHDMLKKYSAAFITEPENISGIAAHIEALWSLYRKKKLPVAAAEYVDQFERKALTGELAKIFASLINLGTHESRVTTASHGVYD